MTDFVVRTNITVAAWDEQEAKQLVDFIISEVTREPAGLFEIIDRFPDSVAGPVSRVALVAAQVV